MRNTAFHPLRSRNLGKKVLILARGKIELLDLPHCGAALVCTSREIHRELKTKNLFFSPFSIELYNQLCSGPESCCFNHGNGPWVCIFAICALCASVGGLI